MDSKTLKRIVAGYEIPVPEGHLRKHKGFRHTFVRSGSIGTVIKGLVAELGHDPTFRSTGLASPALRFQDGTIVWLPTALDGDFGTVSVPT